MYTWNEYIFDIHLPNMYIKNHTQCRSDKNQYWVGIWNCSKHQLIILVVLKIYNYDSKNGMPSSDTYPVLNKMKKPNNHPQEP